MTEPGATVRPPPDLAGAFAIDLKSSLVGLGKRRLDAERHVARHHLRYGATVFSSLSRGLESGGVKPGNRSKDLECAGRDLPIAVDLLEGDGGVYLKPGWGRASVAEARREGLGEAAGVRGRNEFFRTRRAP